MNLSDKYVAIWLSDTAARLFLGLAVPEKSNTRWVVLGKVNGEHEPIGIWVEIERLEEWRSWNERAMWKVTPPTCLLRWEYIIHAQVSDERIVDTKRIGFQPQNDPKSRPD